MKTGNSIKLFDSKQYPKKHFQSSLEVVIRNRVDLLIWNPTNYQICDGVIYNFRYINLPFLIF